MQALTWNLFHGRDAPPDPSLFTWRSRLLRVTERNASHVQVNRDLLPEFRRVLCAATWDVALLQECPPRFVAPLAQACGAQAHRALTSRNSLWPLRGALARLNPDLLGSAEGGCNLILVRGEPGAIADARRLTIRRGAPERRTMAFARTESGLCVANLHTSNDRPDLAGEEVLLAAAAASEWAAERPLLFGGDLNLRPSEHPHVFDELLERFGLAGPTAPGSIDHLLCRDLETLAAPAPWLAAERELSEDGYALRLSDHDPISAALTFAAE